MTSGGDITWTALSPVRCVFMDIVNISLNINPNRQGETLTLHHYNSAWTFSKSLNLF